MLKVFLLIVFLLVMLGYCVYMTFSTVTVEVDISGGNRAADASEENIEVSPWYGSRLSGGNCNNEGYNSFQVLIVATKGSRVEIDKSADIIFNGIKYSLCVKPDYVNFFTPKDDNASVCGYYKSDSTIFPLGNGDLIIRYHVNGAQKTKTFHVVIFKKRQFVNPLWYLTFSGH